MNCQDFKDIVYDLADDQSSSERLAGAVRRSALAHALACGHCAARLSQARLLFDGLIGVAEQTEREMAPARLKRSLLSAFEQHHLELHRAASIALAAQTLPTARRRFDWRPRWDWATGATVAAILVVVALVVGGLISRSSNKVNQLKEEQATFHPTPTPPLRPDLPSSPLPQPSTTTLPAIIDVQPSTVQRVVAGTEKTHPSVRRLHSAEPITRAGNRTDDLDVATEYIPLTYTSAATAPQGGMVVRVEVPRSALLAMGLPINVERAKENVKADVLMGSDGVALAIRLVNEGRPR